MRVYCRGWFNWEYYDLIWHVGVGVGVVWKGLQSRLGRIVSGWRRRLEGNFLSVPVGFFSGDILTGQTRKNSKTSYKNHPGIEICTVGIETNNSSDITKSVYLFIIYLPTSRLIKYIYSITFHPMACSCSSSTIANCFNIRVE